MTIELNLDGLVGPTHNYAGLSMGNIASGANRGQVSNPRAAALQGLKKMRRLMALGLHQGIMPPHERPFLPVLRQIGFSGDDRILIEQAWKSNPALVANLSSAAAMWTANAATVGPAVDSADGKLHFSPANLVAMPHRAIEAQTTRRLLNAIFKDQDRFEVHPALPSNSLFGDEGAANHNRLAINHGSIGLHIFVHGRSAFNPENNPLTFPARQTLEASQAISRRHQLEDNTVIHLCQSTEAINAGAFHNDVVCVANETVFLFHERAFDNPEDVMNLIKRYADQQGFEPCFIMANETVFSLENAIRSYFFNSQLVTRPSGEMALILPSDVEENEQARTFANICLEGENPISELHFLDLKQSMRNGGGPACLRLRVPISESDLKAVHQPILMTEHRLQELEAWVSKHYREYLAPADLGDPNLLVETQEALDQLTQILDLGSFYDFQCEQPSSNIMWD